MENKNLARFLLTFFLGWIGSLIINHSSLKVEGWTSRTGCYILLTIVTFGIYQIVASDRGFHLQPDLRRLQAQEHRLQEGRGSGLIFP